MSSKLLDPGYLRDDGDLVDARRHNYLVEVLHLARLIEDDAPFRRLSRRCDLPDGGGESEEVAQLEVVDVVLQIFLYGLRMREVGSA